MKSSNGLPTIPHKHAPLTRRVTLTVVILVLAISATTVLTPSLRWRAQVVALRAAGKLPDIQWADLFAFILPGLEQVDSMARLITTLNPYAVITNPRTSIDDVNAGRQLFRRQCSSCHGPDASGSPLGPSLVSRDFIHGESDWAIYRTIRFGVAGTAMAPHAIARSEIWQVISYIRAMDAAVRKNVTTAEAATPVVSVPYEELKEIREPSNDWLSYSGSYSSVRHSKLTGINTKNVNRLALRWIHQFEGSPTSTKTSPVVRNGIAYITSSFGRVLALNAATGRELWSFDRKMPSEIAAAPGNRGVAILGDKIFVGTRDAKLIALAAATGRLVWETTVANYDRYYISSAPLVFRDTVITGAGNINGGRGFIAAYDINNGRERWRFNTIPSPGEP